jgi:hypothetical protein
MNVLFLKEGKLLKMNKMGLFFSVLVTLSILSCGGGENELADDNSVVANDDDGKVITDRRVLRNVISDGAIDFNPEECEKTNGNDWDNFLGIPYGMSEVHLDTIFGKSNGGEYSDDSTFFVFYFKGIERVPISIWSNSQTTQIETIFMEVTSFVQYFKADIAEVTDYYDLRECDTKWFGLQPKEIKKLMGEPTKEESIKDDDDLEIISLEYDSDDLKKVVSFRCYESQDYYCSLVMLNWFY